MVGISRLDFIKQVATGVAVLGTKPQSIISALEAQAASLDLVVNINFAPRPEDCCPENDKVESIQFVEPNGELGEPIRMTSMDDVITYTQRLARLANHHSSRDIRLQYNFIPVDNNAAPIKVGPISFIDDGSLNNVSYVGFSGPEHNENHRGYASIQSVVRADGSFDTPIKIILSHPKGTILLSQLFPSVNRVETTKFGVTESGTEIVYLSAKGHGVINNVSMSLFTESRRYEYGDSNFNGITVDGGAKFFFRNVIVSDPESYSEQTRTRISTGSSVRIEGSSQVIFGREGFRTDLRADYGITIREGGKLLLENSIDPNIMNYGLAPAQIIDESGQVIAQADFPQTLIEDKIASAYYAKYLPIIATGSQQASSPSR